MRKKEKIIPADTPLRTKLYKIIFETNTPSGKLFDVILLWAIVLSVIAVVLESVTGIGERYGNYLRGLEWIFTIIFTVEYALRIFCVQRPSAYIFSFFGIVDFLAVIPAYLTLFIHAGPSLLVIRALRLLRVFRVLKLARYLGEFNVLIKALKASRDKIIVFLFVIMTVTLIMGTIMYLIEGEEHGFSSIPKGVYWAVVTMTTVGYGDIAPETAWGQILASFIMILGYAIIVVPTGVFSVELHQAMKHSESVRVCPECAREGHEVSSLYCRFCGGKLIEK